MATKLKKLGGTIDNSFGSRLRADTPTVLFANYVEARRAKLGRNVGASQATQHQLAYPLEESTWRGVDFPMQIMGAENMELDEQLRDTENGGCRLYGQSATIWIPGVGSVLPTSLPSKLHLKAHTSSIKESLQPDLVAANEKLRTFLEPREGKFSFVFGAGFTWGKKGPRR
ncbi:hypothetical protein COLO4_21279 [Corchorus olitorius]|uniref:Uncharacterized protein n=1 Tax=Corchorus olitorius TaxID=93759 RepID=A0A1R3IUD8_9ROSI|nr:hypothetical protein COLO4_21279 [Corchorus olitorius]